MFWIKITAFLQGFCNFEKAQHCVTNQTIVACLTSFSKSHAARGELN